MNDLNIRRVVHDMRGYAHNIAMASDAVKKYTNDPDVLRTIDLLDKSCQYIRRSMEILHEIVNYKGYEVKVNYSVCPISEFIAEYVEWVTPLLKKNEINFEYKIDVKKDEFVCDYGMLLTIINNLVGNAIKYNNKDEKKISLTVKQNKNGYAFCVEDNGIGIPSEEIEMVTSCHYRATNADSSLVKGNGLGLNLVYEVVKKLEGSLNIESTLNVGSKFTVTLPEGTVTMLRSDNYKPMFMREPVQEYLFYDCN